MRKPEPTRFHVSDKNVAAAVEHVTARGFPPMNLEQGDNGTTALIFPPLPDADMYRLVQALPLHLSAKMGIVANGPKDFRRLTQGMGEPS